MTSRQVKLHIWKLHILGLMRLAACESVNAANAVNADHEPYSQHVSVNEISFHAHIVKQGAYCSITAFITPSEIMAAVVVPLTAMHSEN